MKTLLLGMGNPILCDDAVGVRLANEFALRVGPIPGLDVVPECCVGGLNLLDVVAGYDRLVVLDSIQTVGGKPGNWYRFTEDRLEDTLHLTNVHDANFATALALGRKLGMHLPAPEENHIFAVEVSDACTFSNRMTAALEAGFGEYASEIFAEVEPLLRGN